MDAAQFFQTSRMFDCPDRDNLEVWCRDGEFDKAI